MPRLQNLLVKYGGSVEFVAVNDKSGQPSDVLSWLNAPQPPTGTGCGGVVTFPVLHDANWAITSLYLTGTFYWPVLYVIGADGTVQLIHETGASDSAPTESTVDGYIQQVVYTRDPVDVELVVDVSDSMNSPPPTAPGGDSKLTLLRQAANVVMDVFRDHKTANDAMGIVRFTDNATAFEHAGKQLLDFAQNEGRLRDEIAALTTGTCTALGAGLQLAFDSLVAEGSQPRFAIVCTDGMQNIEPKVADVGGHYEIVDSGGWLCGAHSSTAAHPGVDIRNYQTRVHTIGIGIGAEWEPLLQEVADQTGGFHRSTSDPTADLALIYTVDLCTCLSAGSPTVVRHATGILASERCQAVETFFLNRTARKLTVALFWPRSEPCSLTFWLRAPGGALVPLDGALRTLGDRCVATLYLPVEIDGQRIDHVGRWTMIIRGETRAGTAPYQVLVVAEDRDVKCVVDYPRRAYAVGDVVPLVARMPRGDDRYRVLDVVLDTIRLRTPLAEILERYPMSLLELERVAAARPGSRRDPAALLHAKLRRIEADPAMGRLLEPERKRTSLRTGTLECTLGDREVTIPVRLAQPGVTSYRLELLCQSGGSGPVARTEYLSVFAHPGPVDLKRTTVGAVRRAGEAGPGVLITLTPRNEHGQPFGPGFGGQIRVFDGREPIEVAVNDLIDGTYEVEVDRGRKHPEHEVSVAFLGKTVWTGRV